MDISDLRKELETITAAWQHDLAHCTTLAEVENLRRIYWGKQGSGTLLVSRIPEVSPEDRRQIAPAIQAFAHTAKRALADLQEQLTQRAHQERLAQEANFDVTAPAVAPAGGPTHGSLHPCVRVARKIDSIMQAMGFRPTSGPEVETAWNNFHALNIGPHHPARDMQDTLWLQQQDASGEPLLLRTHTSNVQIRTMLMHQPPFAVYTIGRVYRHEATDATHDYVFHQLEILLLDKTISVAHLSSLITHFMQALFERSDLQIRLRPSYFPFVEPGLEIDISCIFCDSGCSVCKHTRWIEIGGAGMVHPATLRAVNHDPDQWTGIAWGLGIERLTMLMYGVQDIRLFHQATVDMLAQWN